MMILKLWNRLIGKDDSTLARVEGEREQMSGDERRLSEKSIDDVKADSFVGEHLAGTPPDRFVGEESEM